MTLLGSSFCCLKSQGSASPLLMQRLREIGASVVRLWIEWATAEPARGVFDWSKVDADFAAIHAAGLTVHANVWTAPEWASGGFPTYRAFTEGCTRFKPGVIGEIEFDDAREFCTRPPHIDAAVSERFGYVLGQRYGSRISYFGVGNEPGGSGGIFWPPAASDPDGWVARLCDEYMLPMLDGFTDARHDAGNVHDLGASFTGPEADGAGDLDDILGANQVIDIATCHAYPFGLGWANALKRYDEFRAVPNLLKRTLWCSETGPDASAPLSEFPEFLRETIRRGWPLVSLYQEDALFEDGTGSRFRGGNETFVISAIGREVQSIMAEHHAVTPTRRRAVN